MRIVVIGGVAAGMSAASQAKRRNPACEVIVLERGDDISYSACGMPYNIGDPARNIDDLVILDAAQARTQRDIDVRTGHEVTALDAAGKTVTFRSGGGAQAPTLAWDRLVIATGASAIIPKIPGLGLPGVFVLRDLTDARAIKSHLRRSLVTKAVIVGAGYIGMEMADALHELGIAVTIIEKADQALPGFAPAIVAIAQQELARCGVTVQTGTSLQAIHRLGDGLAVSTGKGELGAQIVIVAVGARASTGIAAAAGIMLGPTGAIAVDDHMRTSAPDIYAAGDCAEAQHLVLGRPVWIPLGTTANKQGKVAGANAAGGDERFGGIVGTAGFKLFQLEVARTGLGGPDLAGFDAIAAVSHHHSRARAYPGDRPITTLVYAERGTGRLLGAQMIGGEAVAKRIDIFATALHAGMTLAQVEQLDLSYAPPFAPVYDPVLVAATVALKQLRR